MILILGSLPAIGTQVMAEGVANRAEQQKQVIAQKILQQRQLQEGQMILQARQQQEMMMRQRMMQRAVQERRMLQEKQAVTQVQKQRMAQQQQLAYQQAAAVKKTQMMRQAVTQQQAMEQAALLQQQAAAQTALLQNAKNQQYRPENVQETWDRVNDTGDNPVQDVQEVVGMKQIAEELKISSEVWPLIIDHEPKQTIVKEYIDWYKKQNVIIRKDPAHYIQMIDAMSQENPDLLKQPFANLFKLMAIVDYDFDNGRDKDLLARTVLGEKLYADNKKRLGL